MSIVKLFIDLILVFVGLTLIIPLIARRNEFYIGTKKVTIYPGMVLLHIGKGLGRTFTPVKKRYEALGTIASIILLVIGLLFFYVLLLPRITLFLTKYAMGKATPIQAPVQPIFAILTSPLSVIVVIMSIAIAVILHEVFHAKVALRNGIRLKSWGFGLFLLFPIAFVEVNEEDFKSRSLGARLRVLGAGIAANALLAALFFILTIIIPHIALASNITTLIVIDGVDCSICNTSLCPAKISRIEPGDIIIAVDGHKVKGVATLVRVLNSKHIGDNLTLTIYRNGEFIEKVLTLNASRSDNTTKPCIGVRFHEEWFESREIGPIKSMKTNILFITYSFVFISYLINFSLFIINAAPLFITDGHRMLIEIIERFKIYKARTLLNVLGIINILVLIAIIVITTLAYI